MSFFKRNDKLWDLVYGQRNDSFTFLFEHVNVLIKLVLTDVYTMIFQELVITTEDFSRCNSLSIVIKDVNYGRNTFS
jgi:hypothetical protein